MDFVSSAVMGGILYDGFKVAGAISADFLKAKLTGWIFEDKTIEELASKVNEMGLSDYHDRGIQKRLEESSEIMALLEKITASVNVTNISQVHNGTGDNVAGNKTVINK
ncbi:hypothetical protein NDN17_15460 [Shewanella algae]|uniref:GapS6a family protein n=1 Tax=Shewanella algae TaxID=38313 RepID=UPI001183168E|nr:hypothetical protein [Shewanella algae]MCM2529898.1 hypothetical protein [Shewanella algae]TVK93815.1 hypothetical protein AYJ01_09325 [Shewanella algae]